MPIVTKYYCDVCGKEDPKCEAWTLAPTWVRRSAKGISYQACRECVGLVVSTVSKILVYQEESI